MGRVRHRSAVALGQGEEQLRLYLVIVNAEGWDVWMTSTQAKRVERRLEFARQKGVLQDYQIVDEFEGAESHDEFLERLDKKGIF